MVYLMPNLLAYSMILKLTPQSQYGIISAVRNASINDFEVDSTESVWYI